MTKKITFRDVLKWLSVPLTLFVIYLSMILLWKVFELPPTEELVTIITSYFNQYGNCVVFISALIEGFLLLGQYFPGSFVIFLGVVSAGSDTGRAIEVIAIVILAFFISYYGNYLIGRYGFYTLFAKFGLKKPIDKAKKRLSKYGLKAILFSYWEPNLASITATAAGILDFPVKKFLLFSALATIVWTSFWGFLIFKLGKAALEFTGVKYVTIILISWIIIVLAVNFIERKIKGNIR